MQVVVLVPVSPRHALFGFLPNPPQFLWLVAAPHSELSCACTSDYRTVFKYVSGVDMVRHHHLRLVTTFILACNDDGIYTFAKIIV